jgi:RHS repeat-associated protein
VAGGGRTLEYSVFDKPVRIEKDGQSTRFTYGIAHRRISRVDDNAVDGTKTRVYVGSVEFTDDGSSTYFRRQVAGIAEVKFFPATQKSEARYAVKDHLGSSHNLTDESGRIESATWLSFGAFGQRRAANWNAPLGLSSLAAINALSDRGFTGHEHVDSMGLVHMNGRVYDPKLGRFLQADPIVQAPRNTQSLNRYSYALNNPLSMTDPSGYFLKRLVKRWGRLVAAMVISAVLPGGQGILATVFNITGTYAQAAITGFIAGAITSGSLKGAVVGALTAVAVAGIVKAHSTAEAGDPMADPELLRPTRSTVEHLQGSNGDSSGLFRVFTKADGTLDTIQPVFPNDISSGDVVFTNGIKNSFSDAVKNATIHLHQKGLLGESYVLNFNPSEGFWADFLEASRDIVGAHSGWTHSGLAKDLAGLIDDVSSRGVVGLQLVGHSQGGAITASALRYAGKSGLNLSALSGGGVALHGAPVNAWMARERLGSRLGIGIESHHQFGDAVHVLGGLNLTNPLEIPISLLRAPSLFSGDPSLNPHSLPCGNSTSLVCVQ